MTARQTLAEAVLAVRSAVAPLDPTARAQVATARDQSGIPDDEIPAYLPGALAALVGAPTAPTPVAPSERGYAWLLADVAPLIPTATVIDELTRDGLAVAALHRALVITRGADEAWQVIALDAAPSAPVAGEPLSEAALRAWAWDATARLSQDEDLWLARRELVPALAAVAAEAGCPKRATLEAALDRVATLPQPDLAARAAEVRAALATHDVDGWRDWIAALARVATFARGAGPADRTEAAAVADAMLRGRRRPALAIDVGLRDGWWQFRARWPEGAPLDALCVHPATGALAYVGSADASLPAPTADRTATLGGSVAR